jgi:hypothetical protein
MEELGCLARRLLGPRGSRGWWMVWLAAEAVVVALLFTWPNLY